MLIEQTGRRNPLTPGRGISDRSGGECPGRLLHRLGWKLLRTGWGSYSRCCFVLAGMSPSLLSSMWFNQFGVGLAFNINSVRD